MTHTQPQGVASPADAQDRHLFLVGAQPRKDSSDEDLSDTDDGGESVADAMKRDKNRPGDEGDDGELSDVDKDILDEIDESDPDEEGTDGDKASDDKEEDSERSEMDSDLDDEERTYRQRFADTKADRDEKARLLKQTIEENARLKAINAASDDINEVDLAREIQEGIYKEVSAITDKDPNQRTKKAYDAVGKAIASATKKAVQLALTKVSTLRQQELDEQTQQEQGRTIATKRAKIVLKEEGLDPEKHFGMFEEEVNRQMERDPEWFKAIPAEQHFTRLTARVKARIAKNREANSEHQREARGQVNGGSRSTKRPVQTRERESDEGDSLRGAMALAGKANLMRGRRAFQSIR